MWSLRAKRQTSSSILVSTKMCIHVIRSSLQVEIRVLPLPSMWWWLLVGQSKCLLVLTHLPFRWATIAMCLSSMQSMNDDPQSVQKKILTKSIPYNITFECIARAHNHALSDEIPLEILFMSVFCLYFTHHSHLPNINYGFNAYAMVEWTQAETGTAPNTGINVDATQNRTRHFIME